jgi:hypothetical protein
MTGESPRILFPPSSGIGGVAEILMDGSKATLATQHP